MPQTKDGGWILDGPGAFTEKNPHPYSTLGLKNGINKQTKEQLVEYGTSTSGFHGHAGRPGEVGGSAPEGNVGREYLNFGQSPEETKDYDIWSERVAKWGTEKLSPEIKDKTDDESNALSDYQASGYEGINKSLRKGKILPETQIEIDKLDSFFKKAKLEEDVIVYRGVGGGAYEIFSKMGVKSFRDKGFISTSLDAGYAKVYGEQRHGGMIRIKVPKGTHGYFMNGRFSGAFKNEHEVLLSRNKKFKVIGIDLINRIIDVEVVG